MFIVYKRTYSFIVVWSRRPSSASGQVLKGSRSGQSAKRRIENTLRGETAILVNIAYRTSVTRQKLLCTLHTVGINQLLEVAAEVGVHRVAQVGRIRAEYYTMIETVCISVVYIQSVMM